VNLVLVDSHEIDTDQRVVLEGRRAEHLLDVLQVRPGQNVAVGVIRGGRGLAKVLSVHDRQVTLELGALAPVELPVMDLVVAVPRPKVLSRMVRACSAFGLRNIDLIRTWRVDPSFFESPRISEDRLRLDAQLGCEQGRHTHLPVVTVYRRFVDYVHHALAPRLRSESRRLLLVADPSGPESIEQVMLPLASTELTLAVGPEGGFIAPELQTLTNVGGRIVRSGASVLYAESAVVALLAQVTLLCRLGR